MTHSSRNPFLSGAYPVSLTEGYTGWTIWSNGILSCSSGIIVVNESYVESISNGEVVTVSVGVVGLDLERRALTEAIVNDYNMLERGIVCVDLLQGLNRIEVTADQELVRALLADERVSEIMDWSYDLIGQDMSIATPAFNTEFGFSCYRISSEIGSWDETGNCIPRPTAVIRTFAELRAYYERGIPYQSSLGDPVVDALFLNEEVYNDDFFAEKFLVFVYAQESSGTFRHNISEVSAKDGVLKIHAHRIEMRSFTEDMAGWLIAVELCRSLVPLLDSDVEVVWGDVRIVGWVEYFNRWSEENQRVR
jgi:hypothetical protein